MTGVAPKPRVLHVLHHYPPEFRGGVEQAVARVAVRQRAKGAETAVLCGSERVLPCPTTETFEVDGVPVRRLVRGPGLRDPSDPFRADVAKMYDEALAELRPDVVHVHHWTNLTDDLARRAARAGARVVVALNDFFSTCTLGFRSPDGFGACDLPQTPDACAPCVGARFGLDEGETRFRIATRRAAFAAELRAASVVTAPSAAHVAALRPHVPEDVDVRTTPLGSSVAPSLPRTPRTGPLRVLHCGNLCRLKGVELLATAVAIADPEGTRLRLRLAGAVVEPDLRLGRAELTGPYDAEGLARLAAEADVAAFPSYARETYSLVVDEALRHGLPVLVSDRGAPRERVGGRGVVLPAGDVAAWVSTLRRLADDPAALNALAAAPAPELTTCDDYADASLAHYAEALAAPPKVADVEGPLLRRLGNYERSLGHMAEALRAARRV